MDVFKGIGSLLPAGWCVTVSKVSFLFALHRDEELYHRNCLITLSYRKNNQRRCLSNAFQPIRQKEMLPSCTNDCG